MNPHLALVFPGQGSQSLGMLAELAQSDALIQTTFAEASEGAGVDLWGIAQNDEARLNQTEFTQPALLAAGIAVWRLWQSRGGAAPASFAGHSLGEYTALVAAGALPLHDGARLVRERGRLMQAAVPAGTGAMAAVLGAEDALVLEVCEAVSSAASVVVPANYNSPGQIVIGGHADAVDRALTELSARGVRKAVKLAVSVPSHTPLMREAADALGVFMRELHWRMPDRPVVQNVDAQVQDSAEAIQQALVQQLYQPVRWTQCVQALAAGGATQFIECGPGKVLAGLIKRIDKSLDTRTTAAISEMENALQIGENA